VPYKKGPVKLITFNEVGGEIEIHNPTPSRLDDIPRIDNSLPILRAPNAFTYSLTLSGEGVTKAGELKVSHWGALSQVLRALKPIKKAAAEKDRLTAEFHRQIRHETELAQEMNQRMECFNSSREDEGGNIINLGTGVRNPASGGIVAPFTVLGPYAGVFLDSEAAFSRAVRRAGSIRNCSHSWQSRSLQRVVDGWESGNILRNVNTHRLGDAAAVAQPNVAMVRVGKNIAFYVTTKEVRPGEEYFVDYGADYNPRFAIDSARQEERVAHCWLQHRAEVQAQGISLEHMACRYALSPKYLGKAVLRLRQENSSAAALAIDAQNWLEEHPLADPSRLNKEAEVAALYLRHQAEAESWGITPERMAEHYGAREEALHNRLERPQKIQPLAKLSQTAQRWLDELKVPDSSLNIKQEPADISADFPPSPRRHRSSSHTDTPRPS